MHCFAGRKRVQTSNNENSVRKGQVPLPALLSRCPAVIYNHLYDLIITATPPRERMHHPRHRLLSHNDNPTSSSAPSSSLRHSHLHHPIASYCFRHGITTIPHTPLGQNLHRVLPPSVQSLLPSRPDLPPPPCLSFLSSCCEHRSQLAILSRHAPPSVTSLSSMDLRTAIVDLQSLPSVHLHSVLQRRMPPPSPYLRAIATHTCHTNACLTVTGDHNSAAR